MQHESRLTSELRRLLLARRSAALGTLDVDGLPHVSMTPYAIDAEAPGLVLLISGLAAHTGHIRRNPQVSLLITDHETPGEPVHALGRMTLAATARLIEPGTDEAERLRRVYLQRFPEAESIGALPDFRYVGVQVQAIRQIAGFGAARDVTVEAFENLLRSL